MRVVQNFEVATEPEQEEWQLKITNPDSGDFRLVLTDPKTNKKTVTEKIKANSSANDLRHWLYKNGAVKGYYFWRSRIGHHMLNVYKETDKATNVVTYRVQLPYQQDGPGILSIQVLKGTSKS